MPRWNSATDIPFLLCSTAIGPNSGTAKKTKFSQPARRNSRLNKLTRSTNGIQLLRRLSGHIPSSISMPVPRHVSIQQPGIIQLQRRCYIIYQTAAIRKLHATVCPHNEVMALARCIWYQEDERFINLVRSANKTYQPRFSRKYCLSC